MFINLEKLGNSPSKFYIENNFSICEISSSRHYDPSTGRFLQQDPDPGKLVDPRTFLSKYVYAGNNPVMMSDPSGRFWWALAIVVASGILQGMNNLNAAKEAGYGGDKLWQTFLSGFIMGSVQAAATIVYGPWVGLGASFVTGALNNAINQRIFIDKNKDGIDWGSAGTSGLVSAGGFAMGYGLGYAAGETLGLATQKYTGTYGSGQAASDFFGIFGSHIPAGSAPNGISKCEGVGCSSYNINTGEMH